MRPRPGFVWQKALAVLVGLGIVLIVMTWSTAHPARGMLEVLGSATVNVGPCPQGEYRQQAWSIRNVGTTPLTLRTRFTSGRCGFSLWQGEEHVLPAGARSTVYLTWRSSDHLAVPFNDHAEVWTNDPLLPKVKFRVVGITGPGR